MTEDELNRLDLTQPGIAMCVIADLLGVPVFPANGVIIRVAELLRQNKALAKKKEAEK
mgnify:CR=1 FL=1